MNDKKRPEWIHADQKSFGVLLMLLVLDDLKEKRAIQRQAISIDQENLMDYIDGRTH